MKRSATAGTVATLAVGSWAHDPGQHPALLEPLSHDACPLEHPGRQIRNPLGHYSLNARGSFRGMDGAGHGARRGAVGEGNTGRVLSRRVRA